ncbi:FBLN2 protein, partial [Atractosteus spatula]|nr:FBLN2 protein [Atractosteus spatula]
MAKYKLMKSILFMTVLVLYISGALCQKDCTGVDCPLLEHCIEEVLERGACCASCLQKGCTCEGYQYYDCINAGFRNGKVPEGESYFVDFGSTECSCPKGGGKISCHFIPCPEVPPHCIEFSEPADGCLQCERFGCVHDGHKYDAGHTFQMDPCKVCHCPHAGGELMCYPVPDFTLVSYSDKPAAHEMFNEDLKQELRQKIRTQEEETKNEEITEDPLVETVPAVESNSHSSTTEENFLVHEDPLGKHGQAVLPTIKFSPTTQPPQIMKAVEGLISKKQSQTLYNYQPERERRNNSVDSHPASQGGVTTVIAPRCTSTVSTIYKSLSTFYILCLVKIFMLHSKQDVDSTYCSRRAGCVLAVKHDCCFNDSICLSFFVYVCDAENCMPPQRSDLRRAKTTQQRGVLFSLFSGHLLVATCCEAGQKWASDNGHCTGMPQREVNTCRIAEQQCCLGHLRDSKCLAGMTAAKEGKMCELGERDTCGADSYMAKKWMACCSCCSLGLQFRSEGHNCDSHQHLVYPCSHMFLTCCEGEDGLSQPTLRERQKPEPTSLPKRGQFQIGTGDSASCYCPIEPTDLDFKAQVPNSPIASERHLFNTVYCSLVFQVSDGTYDKEAFSITDEEGNENTVEKGEDIDECVEYEGQLCHQRCINTRTSYECACFPGYILLSDGYSCEPENPEEEDNRLREEDRPATPVPTVAASTTVIPVDLCAEHMSPGTSGHPMSQPLLNSNYNTDMIRAFWDGIYIGCTKTLKRTSCTSRVVIKSFSILSPPPIGNGPCMHVCSQAAGEVLCSCFPGYALMADGHSCEDVNECHSGTHSCPRGVLCVNSKGSFQCVRVNEPCEEGFIYNVNRECVVFQVIISARSDCYSRLKKCECSSKLSVSKSGFYLWKLADIFLSFPADINECLTNTHSCQAMERCINTIGSFTCEKQITCSPGYQLKEDTCEDIDECLQQTHNCGTGFECQNTAGSFYCNPKHRCFTGFSQDQHGNCIAGSVSNFKLFFIIVVILLFFSADIDECSSPNVPCSPGFNCINTVGSYTCQRKIIVCSRGYHASPDGARCIDVDECQTGVHRCGEGQICHNLPGTYRCDCKTGYQYDMFRKVCVEFSPTDVNECWRYPGRLCAQTCENTPGSYQCSCTAGFTLSSDGKNCEDVNECEKNPCSQECANIYGSYQCYCRQGFYLKEDGHSCEDIDECSQSVGNLCAFQCVNVPGSYQCACPAHGYTMSPNGRTCRDIDECAVGTHNCSTAETCYNIQGGFRCLSFSCPPNYRRVSDTRCERISCPNYVECQSSPFRITYYHLSFQTNIVIPAQIFRIGPSPAYSGDNIIISITRGNGENYFSARKLNSYTGAVYLQRQVREPKDFLIDVEMKLWRQGNFTTFLARIYVFITAPSL